MGPFAILYEWRFEAAAPLELAAQHQPLPSPKYLSALNIMCNAWRSPDMSVKPRNAGARLIDEETAQRCFGKFVSRCLQGRWPNEDGVARTIYDVALLLGPVFAEALCRTQSEAARPREEQGWDLAMRTKWTKGYRTVRSWGVGASLRWISHRTTRSWPSSDFRRFRNGRSWVHSTGPSSETKSILVA